MTVYSPPSRKRPSGSPQDTGRQQSTGDTSIAGGNEARRLSRVRDIGTSRLRVNKPEGDSCATEDRDRDGKHRKEARSVENRTRFVKCELTGDSWTVRSQDLTQSDFRTKFAHREYPENTAPHPEDVDITTIDLDEITFATEIALVRRYGDVLWTKGSQRANLQRLQEIHTDTLDPAEEPVTQQWVSMNLGLTAASAKRTLVSEFETMGELASCALYATTLTDRPHIGESTATQLRARRATFIRWFGGEEYIPAYDDNQRMLTTTGREY